MQNYHGTVIFDRGIPDMIAYAHGASLDLTHVQKAAKKYLYNNLVFHTSGWKEIYQTDDERKMSFEAATQFGDDVKNIYLKLGYKVIDVPFDTPEMRAKFIINIISNNISDDV